MNFKVGNRVRIKSWGKMKKEFGVDSTGDIKVRYSFSKAMKHLCGRTATITSINNGKIILSEWSDKEGDLDWCFSTEMVELYNFTIKNLQNEDIVTLRNGEKLRYIDDEFEDLIEHPKNDITDISDINDDLTRKNSNRDYDIIRVERPTYTTIYTREDKLKEMTIDELEEKLGMTKGTLRIKGEEKE